MTPGFSISLSGISKFYPGVVALSDVRLEIAAGEVVGLIGENGAGKSTLMKVLGGTISPDRGTIEVAGEKRDSLTPSGAMARGIAFVHQELNPFTNLDVTANILLGREKTKGLFRMLDRQAMEDEVRPILDMLAAPFGPSDPVSGLSLAEQQLLEIARALSIDARLVIMDEPTSSLTLSETRRLLDVIRQLQKRGVAVLFISHRLNEVEEGALLDDELWEDAAQALLAIDDTAEQFLQALPKAKGKRLGMLGILGMAIAAPVIILYCGHLLAEGSGMERTEQRVFTLLSFYATAIPLLILGVVVVHEGWGANPNSVRRQCFLYLCFLLGVAGVVVNDPDLGFPAVLAIGFGIISQSLLLICLPIMKGCRLRLIGMGIVTIIGPISVAAVAVRIAKDQFNLRSGDRFDMVMLVVFAAAIVLSLLAMFRLRHGWIAEEAKRKVGWLGNVLLVLNLFAPIGLYVLAMLW